MSSPPLNKSCNRAGLFKRPVRSSASSRWPQALVQNRKQLRLRSFVLAAWPSCRGPRQPAANELGGGPVRHVLSPSSNAWPARRRQARPRHIPHPTSLRALHRVPSSVALRAHLPRPHSVEASGSAFPIKTGSAFPIGITSWVFPWEIRAKQGMLPRRSKNVCSFTAPLRRRNCARGTGSSRGRSLYCRGRRRSAPGPHRRVPRQRASALDRSALEQSRRRCASRECGWHRPTCSARSSHESPRGRASARQPADTS